MRDDTLKKFAKDHQVSTYEAAAAIRLAEQKGISSEEALALNQEVDRKLASGAMLEEVEKQFGWLPQLENLKNVNNTRSETYQKIWDACVNSGRYLTAQEIADQLEMKVSSIRPRVNELYACGILVNMGNVVIDEIWHYVYKPILIGKWERVHHKTRYIPRSSDLKFHQMPNKVVKIALTLVRDRFLPETVRYGVTMDLKDAFDFVVEKNPQIVPGEDSADRFATLTGSYKAMEAFLLKWTTEYEQWEEAFRNLKDNPEHKPRKNNDEPLFVGAIEGIAEDDREEEEVKTKEENEEVDEEKDFLNEGNDF